MSSKEPDKGSGQMAQFIEAARELGCDDDPERFKETVRKIAESSAATQSGEGEVCQGSTPMSLEWEKAHLLRADQFVADGERRVSEQATRINHMLDSGHDVSEAQGRLTTLKVALAKWYVHRAEIHQHINRMEAQAT